MRGGELGDRFREPSGGAVINVPRRSLLLRLLIEDLVLLMLVACAIGLLIAGIRDDPMRAAGLLFLLMAVVRLAHDLVKFRTGRFVVATLKRVLKQYRGVKRCEFALEASHSQENARLVEANVCGAIYEPGTAVLLMLDKKGTSAQAIGPARRFAGLL